MSSTEGDSEYNVQPNSWFIILVIVYSMMILSCLHKDMYLWAMVDCLNVLGFSTLTLGVKKDKPILRYTKPV